MPRSPPSAHSTGVTSIRKEVLTSYHSGASESDKSKCDIHDYHVSLSHIEHRWLTKGFLQEVDVDDNDSTVGSDAASSTASISSSILQYRNVLGRTYHSDSVTDGEYWYA